MGCFLLLAYPNEYALAKTRNCKTLYKQKQYAAAGHCYFANAKQRSITRIQQGRLLRNAAFSLSKAAINTRSVSRRAYLYEQAGRMMHRYVRQRLAENPYRHKSGKRIRDKLFRKVGYASLRIVTDHKQARISIRGYRFRQTSTHTLKHWIRPGTYTLVVSLSGQKRHTRTIHIKASQQTLLTLRVAQATTPTRRPPPRRAPSPSLPSPLTNDPDNMPDPLQDGPTEPTRRPSNTRKHTTRRTPPPTRIKPRIRRPAPRQTEPTIQDLLPLYNIPPNTQKHTTRHPQPRPQPKAKGNPARVVALSFLVLGLGTAIAGGVVHIVGYTEFESAKQSRNDALLPNNQVNPTTTVSSTQGIADSVRHAQTLNQIGWGLTIGGGAAAIGAFVTLLVIPTRPPRANGTQLDTSDWNL